MKFRITDDNIRRGERYNCYGCPGALAILDVLPDSHVAVGRFTTTVNGAFFPTPENIRRFIHLYDSGQAVAGIEFELPIGEGGK
jgi:hypothetical protein